MLARRHRLGDDLGGLADISCIVGRRNVVKVLVAALDRLVLKRIPLKKFGCKKLPFRKIKILIRGTIDRVSLDIFLGICREKDRNQVLSDRERYGRWSDTERTK